MCRVFKQLKDLFWLSFINSQLRNNISEMNQKVEKYINDCGFEIRNELEGDITTCTKTREAVITQVQIGELEKWCIDAIGLLVNATLSEIGQSIVNEANRLLSQQVIKKVRIYTPKNIIHTVNVRAKDEQYIISFEYAYKL